MVPKQERYGDPNALKIGKSEIVKSAKAKSWIFS